MGNSRCAHRRAARRRFLFETLEHRVLLDGASLVHDDYDVQQNAGLQTLDVLANDLFDGDYAGDRQISSVSFGSEGGRIAINAARDALTYTPPADFAGDEKFVYVVDDQFTASVRIEITSPLEDDEFIIRPDGTTHTLPVQANDPFWPDYDGPRTITLISTTSLGAQVEVAADGQSLLYTPPEHAYGKDRLVYIVDGRYSADVEIELPNPLERDDDIDVLMHSEDNRIDVLANDPFWPGYVGARQITLVIPSDKGATVTIADDGHSVDYTPAADFSGSDSFRYVVDGLYETSVRIAVRRPVHDDEFEVDTGTTQFRLTLTRNDTYTDSDRILHDVIDRVTSVGTPSKGGQITITDDEQGVRYTAPDGFEGVETFEYVADGQYTAQVTVHVTRPVRNDSETVYEDTTNNTLNVLANDFKGNGYDGPGLITAVSETAEGGTVVVADDGRSLRFMPLPGFRGYDSLTYTVDDTYQASVRISVEALAERDSYQFCLNQLSPFALDVLENDHFGTYYHGPGLITSVGPTDNGASVTIAAGGQSIRYAPGLAGNDRFTYVVDAKYEATVSVYIGSYLRSDALVVDQNSGATEFAPTENDFSHNSWANGRSCGRYLGARQITDVGAAEQGGVVTLVDDTHVAYTPPADFVGDDQFTYTVDGVMQQTVTVHVIRRVRDDAFRVDVDSDANHLPVLVNDLFGADYFGAGRVTHITDTVAGGTVAIGDDSATIVYAPPAGFQGHDTFTYTVDDALKAEVTVTVAASALDVWPRFDSLADFEQYLIDDALERYADVFGQEEYDWPFGPIFLGGTLASDSSSERSHSETNVQVEGVDEADLIETDGDYLYILKDAELIIADAWPAAEMAILSRTAIEGRTVGEYLHGDRLTVLSQTFTDPWSRSATISFAEPQLADIWYPQPRPTVTWLTVYDVSDPAAPQVVQKTRLDGGFVESRRIDDFVFVVLRNEEVELPRPARVPVEEQDPPDEGDRLPTTTIGPVQYRYETREQYIERVTSEMGNLLEGMLPRFTSFGPDGEVARSGLIATPEEMFQPPSADENNLISVVSLNVDNDAPGISASTGIFAAGAEAIYATLDSLYVFDNQATEEDRAVTQILKFDWDATNGEVVFAAKGQVAGRMHNQFSADDFDGHLRIAATVRNSSSGNYSGRDENVLFVLRDDAGILEFVGGLKNLALDETIRSVRFMGDRAFVTTFRNIDPLFALDLADPERPVAVGHVTMPGYNSYMQLIDANHILAVGRNTPTGGAGPTQVALYDVQDLAHPRLLDRFTFERFSRSEAEVDHHAFGWFAEHQVLAVPTARHYAQRVDRDGDGYREDREWVEENALALFRIDVSVTQPQQGGIVLHGEIEQDSLVRRSAFIDDVLYSVAVNSTIAVDVNDPAHQYAEVRYDPVDPPDDTPIESTTATWQAVARAKRHLADARGIRGGEILGVTVESARWRSGALQTDADDRHTDAVAGFRIVLDTGGGKYLYHADRDDAVALVDDAFEFAPPQVVWHNGALPHDVNGDGQVSPIDAVIPINELNRSGPRSLAVDQVARMIHHRPKHLLDVTGDGFISPLDVLRVINRLNDAAQADGAAEGEPARPIALPGDASRVEAPASNVTPATQFAPNPSPASPTLSPPVSTVAADVIDLLACDRARREQSRRDAAVDSAPVIGDVLPGVLATLSVDAR